MCCSNPGQTMIIFGGLNLSNKKDNIWWLEQKEQKKGQRRFETKGTKHFHVFPYIVIFLPKLKERIYS